MNKIIPFFILFISAILIIAGCKKDNPEPLNPTPSGLFGANKTITLKGTVIDENGQPVEGATVSVGNKTTQTNNNGMFSLANSPVFDKLGFVKVAKLGYFQGSRTFVPSNTGNVVNIRLLTKINVGSVSATQGGTIQSQGVAIDFAPNSFTKNGSAYTGLVSVALKYINPESTFFADEMPGNLLAVQDGGMRGLTSYGMIAVELTDNTGAELQIATGQTATVTFPLSSGLLNSAPQTIDLWSFDENNGYWKHEGVATLQGNSYTAQVSHFSFWNCDVPWAMVMLNGRIKDNNGNPIQGANIIIQSSNNGSAYSYSNANGEFGGYVPMNEALILSIQLLCNNAMQTVFTTQIGPFGVDTNLGDLIVNNSQNTTIVTGTVVDCNNNLVTNGSISTSSGNFFLNNGVFSFLVCGGSVSITAHSQFASGQPQTLSISGSTTNVGAIQACNNGAQVGSVTDIDGNTYNTIVIGNQEWMAENLRTTTYANGDPIPNVTDGTQWQGLTTGAWAHYNNDNQYENPYGKLYNFYTVDDPRNVCPTGWHVPTDAEYTLLTDYLGGAPVAGGKMKSTGTQYWSSPNTDATNESGFSGLPGGFRNGSVSFSSIGDYGTWWSTTEGDTSSVWTRGLIYYNGNVNRTNESKETGVSIRCLRD
jgi:uncharacterized protein (TIGR02145 family)